MLRCSGGWFWGISVQYDAGPLCRMRSKATGQVEEIL